MNFVAENFVYDHNKVNGDPKISKTEIDIDLRESIGSLASISKENAGKGTVDEADNKIYDPNDVKETTNGLQI